MKSQATGIKRILKAFSYSYQGFMSVFKSETAFRQDLLFCAFGAVTAVLLPVGGMAKAIMFFSLFLILLMELVNTAIEVVIDRISESYHDLSKKAKDIGSLLVLLAFVNMAVVWGFILRETFF